MQREERVVLGTDIHWMHPVPEAQGIQRLYAEFVHIDVAVLQVTCHNSDVVACLTFLSLSLQTVESTNDALALQVLLLLHATCCKQHCKMFPPSYHHKKAVQQA